MIGYIAVILMFLALPFVFPYIMGTLWYYWALDEQQRQELQPHHKQYVLGASK